MANNLENRKYHFIYKTTNLINKKYYIGMHSTSNLKDGYLGSGTYLRRSIKKHGKENFKCEILEFCKDREKLIQREREVVNEDCLNDVLCMNLKLGGGSEKGGFDGKKHKEESKRKQSIAKLGNNHGKGNKGIQRYSCSSETKEKMSITRIKLEELKELNRTEEEKTMRKKIKEAKQERTERYLLTKTKSKFTRLSRAEAQTGNKNAEGTVRTEQWKEEKSKNMQGNSNAKGSIRTEEMKQHLRDFYAKKRLEKQLNKEV